MSNIPHTTMLPPANRQPTLRFVDVNLTEILGQAKFLRDINGRELPEEVACSYAVHVSLRLSAGTKMLTQVESHGHQVVLLNPCQYDWMHYICMITRLAHDWEAHDTVTSSTWTSISAE